MSCAQPGARLAAQTCNIERTFNTDGNPMQRSESSSAHHRSLGRMSFALNLFYVDVNEGVQLRIQSFDLCQVCFGQFYRRDLLLADLLSHANGGEKRDITHATIGLGQKAESSMRRVCRMSLFKFPPRLNSERPAHRAIQRQFFFGAERAIGALRKLPQWQRTDCDSYQPKHLNSECRQHAPNMPILAFVEDDLKPAVFFSRAQQACLPRAQDVCILAVHAIYDRPNQFAVGYRSNLHVVCFLQVRLGRCNSCAPLRIVGQQQEAFAGLVQPADWSDPRQGCTSFPEHIVDRFAAFLVGSRRHQPARFVHHEIKFLLPINLILIDENAIPFCTNWRLRIPRYRTVQAYSPGTNQVRSLRARTVPHLRESPRQADAPCRLFPLHRVDAI